MIRSNLLADTPGAVLSAGLAEAGEDVFLVNPTAGTIEALIEVLATNPPPSQVRLFVADGPLKSLLDDFLLASSVADLVAEDRLSIRTLEDVPNSSLLVSRASAVSLVEGETAIAGLASTDEAFVEELYEHYERRWAGAEEFSLRTPARSKILSTMEQELGAETATDLETFLGSLETARGDGDGLDEVTISLLVAARNGELLYDISKWGEDIGLASKATFSRTKTRLEETGLIDTEKVPIDVGRPRLRLVLGTTDLAEAEVAELATAAQEQLA
jgi:hypothetical protein